MSSVANPYLWFNLGTFAKIVGAGWVLVGLAYFAVRRYVLRIPATAYQEEAT